MVNIPERLVGSASFKIHHNTIEGHGVLAGRVYGFVGLKVSGQAYNVTEQELFYCQWLME